MTTVSVVMSVYNGAATVRQAVESVLAQTHPDFQFVIIDDGSTDATPDILSSFGDTRIRVIRQENAGLTVSLNRGVEASEGELIVRMDADDVSMPSRIEAQLKAFESDSDLVLLGCDADRIDEAGNVVGNIRHLLRDDRIRRVYPVGNQFVHGSCVFRRDAFLQVGGYDESMRYSQDFDLWWRTMKVGKVGNLPRTLYQLRESPERISTRHSEAQDRDRDRVIQRIWNEITEAVAGFPETGEGGGDVVMGLDQHTSERKRFYARLLLRMGIGFVLHDDFRRARRYFGWSVVTDPLVKDAWACLVGVHLSPRRLQQHCRERAERFPLYAMIASAGRPDNKSAR